MDCLRCLCDDKDQEYLIDEREARALYAQSREQMNRSNVYQNGSKIRDERKSLKRPVNCSFLNSPGPVTVSPPNQLRERPVALPQRPISLPFVGQKIEKQAQKPRFSQPLAPLNSFIQPVSQHYLIQYQPAPQQKSHQQSTTITPRYKQQKTNFPQPTQTVQPPIPRKSQLRPEPQKTIIVNDYPSIKLNRAQQESRGAQILYCPQQKAEREFRKDLDRMLEEENSKLEPKTTFNSTSRVQMDTLNLLNPDFDNDMVNSKISRAPSGVRNLDDIACTKTQSIGGSSSESSEFSEIIYTLGPLDLNRKKMTNSSINFVRHQEFMPEPMSENLVGKKKSARQSCINK